MTWDYWLTRSRQCTSCKGEGGWICRDIFQRCGTCDGTGEEREEGISLEDALKDSELIKDMREDIWVLING